MTAGTVRARISKSSQKDQRSIYSISISIQVSTPMELRPFTCHRHVDSGLHAESTPLPVLWKEPIVPNRHRAGANEAHLPTQNVPQLWQFIEARLPEYSAEGGDSRVVLDFENRPAHFVHPYVGLLHLLRRRDHGAKLEHHELPAVKSETLLLE